MSASEAGLVVVLLGGAGVIVVGAELFAEHLAAASRALQVSAFALAVLLAGAEPEELATVVTASARSALAIGVGDIIGANLTVALVALGVAAWSRPVRLDRRAFGYAGGGLVAAVICGVMLVDGRLARGEGVALVGGYVVYVATIWLVERRPPALGEVEELEAADVEPVGRSLVLVVVGLALLVGGSVALVEATRRLADGEAAELTLGLTIVGFATGFELVVVAWSAARRGLLDTALAGVVGSFAYNVTLSLGAGALVRPLVVADEGSVARHWWLMVAAFAVVIVVGRRWGLGRPAAGAMMGAYILWVGLVAIF